MRDTHGNIMAEEGVDLCFCGCKYWEDDECVDCGTHIDSIRAVEREADAMRKGETPQHQTISVPTT